MDGPPVDPESAGAATPGRPERTPPSVTFSLEAQNLQRIEIEGNSGHTHRLAAIFVLAARPISPGPWAKPPIVEVCHEPHLSGHRQERAER